MYQSISFLPDLTETVVARISGDLPILQLGGIGGATIHVPGDTATEQADWLLSVAATLRDFANTLSGDVGHVEVSA